MISFFSSNEEMEIRIFFHRLSQEILTSENFSDEYIKQICEKHLSYQSLEHIVIYHKICLFHNSIIFESFFTEFAPVKSC